MADIILGMWTTHGPTLSTTPEEWLLRLPADHANKQHWYRTGLCGWLPRCKHKVMIWRSVGCSRLSGLLMQSI